MNRISLVAGIVAMLWGGQAALLGQQAEPQTRTAHDKAPPDRAPCVISVNGGISRQEIQTVNATLTSTALVDPVMEETLQLDSAIWPQVVAIELAPAGQNATKLVVTVIARPEFPRSPARKVMVSLVNRLKDAYAGDSEARKELETRRVALQEKLETFQKELVELRAKLDELSVSLRQVGNRANDTPLTQPQRDLDDKTSRLEVLTASLNEVDESRKSMLAAAQEVAKARAGLLAVLLAKADAEPGAVQPADLASAKVEAAEAEQSVAELSVPLIMNPQNQWFNVAVQLRMEIAALKTRIARQTDEAQPSTEELAAEMQRLNRVLQSKQQEIEATRTALDRVRTELQKANETGTLTVIGLEQTK